MQFSNYKSSMIRKKLLLRCVWHFWQFTLKELGKKLLEINRKKKHIVTMVSKTAAWRSWQTFTASHLFDPTQCAGI